MRRFVTLIAFIAIIATTSRSLTLPTAAQDVATADHPLVGTWVIAEDGGTPSFTVFSSDGTFHQVEASGAAGIGAWEATGPTTANLTFQGFELDDDGEVGGAVTIRAAIEVSADGQSFTGHFRRST